MWQETELGVKSLADARTQLLWHFNVGRNSNLRTSTFNGTLKILKCSVFFGRPDARFSPSPSEKQELLGYLDHIMLVNLTDLILTYIRANVSISLEDLCIYAFKG